MTSQYWDWDPAAYLREAIFAAKIYLLAACIGLICAVVAGMLGMSLVTLSPPVVVESPAERSISLPPMPAAPDIPSGPKQSAPIHPAMVENSPPGAPPAEDVILARLYLSITEQAKALEALASLAENSSRGMQDVFSVADQLIAALIVQHQTIAPDSPLVMRMSELQGKAERLSAEAQSGNNLPSAQRFKNVAGQFQAVRQEMIKEYRNVTAAIIELKTRKERLAISHQLSDTSEAVRELKSFISSYEETVRRLAESINNVPVSSLEPPRQIDACAEGLRGRVPGFKLTCDVLTFGAPPRDTPLRQMSYSVGSIEECAAYCRPYTGCAGFSFDSRGSGRSKSCYLFGPGARPQAGTGWITVTR
jgi:PAN domain-containing protein